MSLTAFNDLPESIDTRFVMIRYNRIVVRAVTVRQPINIIVTWVLGQADLSKIDLPSNLIYVFIMIDDRRVSKACWTKR